MRKGVKCQVSASRPRHVPRSTLHAHFDCLALVFFALGLMSKPMLVTLPFVMLLLDYWPLQRSVKRAMLRPCNPVCAWSRKNGRSFC